MDLRRFLSEKVFFITKRMCEERNECSYFRQEGVDYDFYHDGHTRTRLSPFHNWPTLCLCHRHPNLRGKVLGCKQDQNGLLVDKRHEVENGNENDGGEEDRQKQTRKPSLEETERETGGPQEGRSEPAD